MATALAPETRIREFLSKYQLDGVRFVSIVGPIVSQTRLSLALSDARPLDNEQAQAALRTINALENLIDMCAPIPISLRNPAIIKKLLIAQENGTLQVNVCIEKLDWESTPEEFSIKK